MNRTMLILVPFASLMGLVLQADAQEVRWRYQIPSAYAGGFLAVGVDGTIYATDNSSLYAVTPAGQLRWVLPGAGGGRPISIMDDGTIITAQRDVVAVNADGSLRWRFELAGGDIHAGPDIGPDGNIYAASATVQQPIGPFSLDPNGALRWWDETRITAEIQSLSRVAFADGVMSFGIIQLRSGRPTVWAHTLAGGFLWEGGQPFGSYPVATPARELVSVWGQVGVMTVRPEDAQLLWNSTPPSGVSILDYPAVGSDGSIYTADYVGGDLWSVRADGSTRWFVPGSGVSIGSVSISPGGRLVVAGGDSGFGTTGWVRGYDAATGTLLWQVDLPPEAGLNQFHWTQRPEFSRDGRSVYVTSRFAGSGVGHCYLYAIGLGGECRADFDGNGQVDFFDYLDFVQAFDANVPGADFDGNGQIDFFDYLDFAAAFDAGC